MVYCGVNKPVARWDVFIFGEQAGDVPIALRGRTGLPK